MSNTSYKNYLEDCLEELIEKANNAKKNAMSKKSEFSQGVSYGHYVTISFLINQAEVFGIKDELKPVIRNFDPDSLL